MSEQVHLVCPRNGETVRCQVCRAPIQHRVEALVMAGPGHRPRCETHDIRLVRSDLPR